ncbi:TRAP transporter small permease [Neobacillus soli]|uniref:TRAP transporter small permease n=1 Tax=Neobacillus soli TaxID=220688 RepID=UPI00082594EF|nr:TRAP transporter small permease [Neobacillus soli]
MNKWNKRYSLFEDIFSGVFLIGGLALIFYEVIMRYIFNSPTTWITEISAVMVTWGILLGMSVALRDKHHISVDILYTLLPQFLQRKIDYFANIIGVIFCLFFTWGGIELIKNAFESGQTSMDTGIPLGFYYFVIPISGILFMVRFIGNIYEVWSSRKETGVERKLNLEEDQNEYSSAF